MEKREYFLSNQNKSLLATYALLSWTPQDDWSRHIPPSSPYKMSHRSFSITSSISPTPPQIYTPKSHRIPCFINEQH